MKTRSLVILLTGLLWIGCGRETGRDPAPAGTPETGPAEVAASRAPDQPDAEADALHKADPAGLYGAGVTAEEVVEIASLNETPEQFLDRPIVVEGVVSEVCPMRGCWMELADEAGGTIRVKVKDGDIVFPLSAKGHSARVEGTLEKVELTEEDARDWMRHEAEELGREFDPASVDGPQVIWRVRGRGAEIESGGGAAG